MALEDIVKSIVQIRDDGSRIVSPTYENKNTALVAQYISELQQANLNTIEGLRKYSSLTGEDPSRNSGERIDLSKKQNISGLSNDLSKYVRTHFKSAVSELKDNNKLELGLKYVPTTELETQNTDYDVVRAVVKACRNRIDLINDNPQEFLNNLSKDGPAILRPYRFLYAEDSLRIGLADVQRQAVRTIRDFGIERFLNATYTHLNSLASQKEKLEEQFERESQGQESFSAVESATFLDGNDTIKRLSKIESDLEMLSKLISDVIGITTRNYLEEEAKKRQQVHRGSE